MDRDTILARYSRLKELLDAREAGLVPDDSLALAFILVTPELVQERTGSAEGMAILEAAEQLIALSPATDGMKQHLLGEVTLLLELGMPSERILATFELDPESNQWGVFRSRGMASREFDVLFSQLNTIYMELVIAFELIHPGLLKPTDGPRIAKLITDRYPTWVSFQEALAAKQTGMHLDRTILTDAQRLTDWGEEWLKRYGPRYPPDLLSRLRMILCGLADLKVCGSGVN